MESFAVHGDAMLGLSVGFVQQGMTPEERRCAYLADVTYVTAKEAGFDHLRDLLALDRQALVHRPFHFALVDRFLLRIVKV